MPPRLVSLRPHILAAAARPRVVPSLPGPRPFTQTASRAGKGKTNRTKKRREKAAAAAAAAEATSSSSSVKPPQSLPWGTYRRDRPLVLFRSWRTVVALGVTAFLGYLAAKQVRGFLSPDTAAESDEEQEAGLSETAQRLNELTLVKTLRTEEGWVEIALDAEKQPKQSADVKESAGLVAQRLAASTHLLGPRRVWWNEQTHEGVSVGWAGSGVMGWPTVVHGGAIAAVVVEAVGLGWEEEWKKGRHVVKVSESTTPPLPSHQPLQLDLTYLAPTRANEFYAVRFRPSPPAVPAQRGAETDLSPRKDMTKREAEVDKQPLAPQTEEWTATLEKAQDGKVRVKARIVMPDHETNGGVRVSDKSSEGKSWWKRLWAN